MVSGLEGLDKAMLAWSKAWTYMKERPGEENPRHRGFALLAAGEGIVGQIEAHPEKIRSACGPNLFLTTLAFPPSKFRDEVVSRISKFEIFKTREGEQILDGITRVLMQAGTEDWRSLRTAAAGEGAILGEMEGHHLDMAAFAVKWARKGNARIELALFELHDIDRNVDIWPWIHEASEAADRAIRMSKSKTDTGLNGFVDLCRSSWNKVTRPLTTKGSHSVRIAGAAEQFRTNMDYPYLWLRRDE